jgi:peptidoglycan-N-acetylglucosamine deacetylase
MTVTQLAVAAGAFQFLPSVAALRPVRRALAPHLSGSGASGHVALTFDDGPHPVATSRLFDVLAERRTTATFFVLGDAARAYPELVRHAAALGHEIGVHGWTHRCHLLHSPHDVAVDLRRTAELVTELTGVAPRYWRPPYGILSGSALVLARRLGLRPVLWTAWGRDWERDATPASVVTHVRTGLRGGGTVLLHDSDVTSAPGSWRTTLLAVPAVLELCAERGWSVGAVREHLGGGR